MRAKTQSLFNCAIQTSAGTFMAVYTATGLKELRFPTGGDVKKMRASTEDEIPRKWIELTEKAIEQILAGRTPSKFPPLDLAGTTFQKSVWDVLLKIPAGKTLSYSEIAEKLGKSGAARAVGGACGANPIPLLIPCHRVLAKSARLGGFSGGLEWKRRLLASEGIQTA